MNNNQSSTPKIIGAVVITGVLLIGFYFLVLNNKTDQNATASTSQINKTATGTSAKATNAEPQTTKSSSSSNSTSSTSASGTYKDGTYTASANYAVPHGNNAIEVTLTIKDGAVTNVSTQHNYNDHESSRYTNNFDEGISGAVVGKKLDAAQVTAINGASDTTDGFNQALDTIISQAKV